MNTLSDVLRGIFQEPQLREDEYINPKDGLIYCKKCNTKRQTIVPLGTGEIRPKVPCQCQTEQQAKEEAERKRWEHFNKVSRLKSNGLQDKTLLEYTFANDTGINPEMQKAHDYVGRWPDMQAGCIGLLLWGGVGTGKSFFAGCIANALLEKGIPVLMTNFSRILNTLSGLFSEDKNRFIDNLNEYSLLIIDDLGIERNSEFALEQVYSVIDARYRSKKPLIVTTNLTLDELKYPKDFAHERIYDRVLERCVPLKINNQNIRQCNAENNFAKARKLLSENDRFRTGQQ